MKENKKIYNLVNIVVFALSFIILITYCSKHINLINMNLIILFFTIFVFISIIKFARLYLIFLEEKIPLNRFIRLYIKTTFVNILIPFKLGEFFRMYCFGREIKNYYKGILGIILDRFVDTIVLLIIIIPMEVIYTGKVSLVSIIMIAFVTLILLFLIFMPSTYKYLNKYIMTSKSNRMSIKTLRILEKINQIHKNGMELLRGRIPLLLIMSGLAWILEYNLINIMANLEIGEFDYNIFSQYLNSAFMPDANIVLVNYMCMSSIIFGIAVLIVYLFKANKNGEKV